MPGLAGRSHEARILITGTKVRPVSKPGRTTRKEKTVLTLACMGCGEMFETGGYSVQDVLDAVGIHKKKVEQWASGDSAVTTE